MGNAVNRYLEKIAMFGFSEQEKLNKIHTEHYIGLHNTLAKHSGPIFAKVNARHDGDVSHGEANKAYMKDVRDTLKSHEKMYQEYEPIYNKYVSSLENVKKGGSKAVREDTPSHRHSMNDYIDGQFADGDFN